MKKTTFFLIITVLLLTISIGTVSAYIIEPGYSYTIGNETYNVSTPLNFSNIRHSDTYIVFDDIGFANSDVTFRDLTFDGNYVSTVDGANDSFYFNTKDNIAFANWTIDNCIFMNFGDDALDMQCSSGETLTNVRIMNCEFINNGDLGVWLHGASTGPINNSWICNNYFSGGARGILLDYVDNSTITGNNINDMSGIGITIDDSQNNTIMMNHIYAATNISVIGASANNIIRDNIGYITETTGTCSIPAASSQVRVAHNLSSRPNSISVSSHGNTTCSNGRSAFNFTYSTTQLTIYTQGNLVNTCKFYWSCSNTTGGSVNPD